MTRPHTLVTSVSFFLLHATHHLSLFDGTRVVLWPVARARAHAQRSGSVLVISAYLTLNICTVWMCAVVWSWEAAAGDRRMLVWQLGKWQAYTTAASLSVTRALSLQLQLGGDSVCCGAYVFVNIPR